MKYLSYIFLIIVNFAITSASAQKVPAYVYSPGTTSKWYLYNYHYVHKKDIKDFSGYYKLYTNFRVDTFCNIVELQTAFCPNENVPPQIVEYVKGMILFNNGNWKPQTQDGKPEKSDLFRWVFIFNCYKNKPVDDCISSSMDFIKKKPDCSTYAESPIIIQFCSDDPEISGTINKIEVVGIN